MRVITYNASPRSGDWLIILTSVCREIKSLYTSLRIINQTQVQNVTHMCIC